jgi:hypothetical protein
MSLDSLLASIFSDQIRVILFVGVLLLGLTEIGHRRGLRLHHAKDEPRKGQIGGVQGAILGLLALLLGFTFSMAVDRYETRRDLVLREANSIGTTYLRASFLPEAHKAAVENALRRYVDARLAFYDAGNDTVKLAAVEADTVRLQNELWAHTVAAGKMAPSPLTVSFVNSLNETIDLDATRLNAMRWHVPGAVWLLVLVVAAAGCYATGFSAGTTCARTTFSNLILPLLIAVVITLISDLDRSRVGLIGVSQQPLVDLKAGLTAPNP